ncbi:pentapeptide repeat-containing protein [Streptomyces sp. NPDC004327]|uniref:pentapeptide repeat-containing protein n=1 Tax=Streptomyces sp. NPDC004327 TaxID=3364699 RepID=UPI0036759B1F
MASPRLTLLLLSLPGVAAVAALLFTWLQVGQAGKELRIAEEGQITTRFNTAIGNLASSSMDVRLGGVYALQRIMKDSAEDQPPVVSVLTAYVRRHAHVPASGADPSPDVQAAMNVLVRRRPDRDGGVVVDLSETALPHWRPTYVAKARSIHLPEAVMTRSDLSGADLAFADMPRATLEAAHLTGTKFGGANLSGTSFRDADLSGADLTRTDLQDTVFTGATLRGATFCSGGGACTGNLTDTDFTRADLTKAQLDQLDLRKAKFCDREMLILSPADNGKPPSPTPSEETSPLACAVLRGAVFVFAHLSAVDLRGADMRGAFLSWADLTGADLRHTNLAGANFTGADLTRADLRQANLVGADLTSAKLTGAKLTGAVLTGTKGLPSR